MNLNQLYAGNDYAYYPYSAMRNRAKFHPDARRVRLVRAFKEHEYHNTKATGFAEVLFLDRDGEIVDETQLKRVKARYILSTWEEHEDEYERRRVEREKREREQRERYARMDAERKRVEEEKAREKEAFYSQLDALNIPRDKVGLTGESVYVNKTTFLEMLNGLRAKGFGERNSQPTSHLERQRTL